MIKKKIIFILISSSIFYLLMDFDSPSFFKVNEGKFYLKLFISLAFGIILNLTVKMNKNN